MPQARSIDEILAKNEERLKRIRSPRDPITGDGCDDVVPRICVEIGGLPISTLWLTEEQIDNCTLTQSLLDAGSIDALLESLDVEITDESRRDLCLEFALSRIKYDAEYFFATLVKIKDKLTGKDVPFYLNRGQRKLLKRIEEQRLAGVPIRIILLKARQWGGSTLVEMYFFWIQTVLKKGYNSIICAHQLSPAGNIRAMYNNAVKNLLQILPSSPIELTRFEGSESTKRVTNRNCTITIGTAINPDSVRSKSAHLAHFSEVAFFPNTQNNKPEDLIASVSSMIPATPLSAIVYESTAKGVGNLFHRLCVAAKSGESPFAFVFVAWFEIDIYSTRLTKKQQIKVAKSLTEYELYLFELGATLEAIAWYRVKNAELSDSVKTKEEFPSDDLEAFQTSGRPAFNASHIERLRSDCCDPIDTYDIAGALPIFEVRKLTREDKYKILSDIKLTPNPHGLLKIWKHPEKSEDGEIYKDRYIVSVDTGGRSSSADYSVICVLDRAPTLWGGVPEIVADWRGHIDHDILCWIAAQIATYYDNAVLVFESNTHESEIDTDGEHGEYIFDQISDVYSNLYARNPSDKIKQTTLPPRWGWHNNRASKTLIVDNYVAVLREQGYIERNEIALNEARLYEQRPNGSWGNVDGSNNHDDVLITRMIALYIAYKLPALVSIDRYNYKERPVSVATM